MGGKRKKLSVANRRWQARSYWLAIAALTAPVCASGAGTQAGTVIDNVATVAYEILGVADSLDSNTVSFEVQERIDVAVSLQSGVVTVAPGETGAVLLFTVANSGNGNDTFSLAVDSTISGDDFDPQPAATSIYFDSDGSGDLSAGDVAYQPGNNDPQLPADATVDVLIVNDIPGGIADGSLGRSQLTATSLTGAGQPGVTLAGLGDGGIDAIVGASGGSASGVGEYRVADILIDIRKSVTVADPFGGNEPTVGATLTYAIEIEVQNAGTATASVFRDPIPNFSTYVPGSLMLNGAQLTDIADADVGEYDTTNAPTIVVSLGDLTLASGIQVVEFQVTID